MPAGHEPGPQTIRNRTSFPVLWVFCGLVGLAMFLAGVFIAAGGRGPRFDRTEEFLGGLFFGGMGFLILAVSYSQYRAQRPPRLKRQIRGAQLAVDREELRRGEQVSATLTLHAAAEGLEVGLVCAERFDLLTTAQTKAGRVTIRQTNEAAFEQWQAVGASAGEHTFTFEIPRDAPFSYEGDCVSYAWRVSARAVRRLRVDPRLDYPIWVRA